MIPATTISGEGVQSLVEVMDRLRSPGGCPWDARQTHVSLVPYALEEAYEVAEAIESGDRAAMREELGDLLLQVVFHARIAQDSPTDPFDLDDVAREITAKLVRRHPHVFDRPASALGADDGSAAGTDLEDLHVQWDRIKRHEIKRESVLDGIPVMKPLDLAVGGTVREMIQSDLRLELSAVKQYNAAIQIATEQKDNGSRDLLVTLLKDEEEHVDWLEAQAHQIEELGYERYLTMQLGGDE